MRGHVTQKGNKWYFVIDVGRKPDGKRNRKWFSGFDTKKQAEKALADKLSELNQGKYVEPTKKRVSKHMDEWLEYKEKKVRSSTFTTYKRLIDNHVKPHIGQMRLDKLHETNIEDLYDHLREEKGLAESTIVKIHADILKPAFKRAMRYRMIHHNPADIEDPPKQKGKPEIQVWDADQVRIFLDEAKKDEQYIIFHLALNTGMRIGEILALQWKNVDFRQKMIHVRHTLSSHSKELREPKTSSSIRDIAIDEITIQELRDRYKTSSKDMENVRDFYSDQGFVCCTRTGKPLLQSNIRRKFNSLIQKADVPKIRIHDMRHTWATLQLLEGTEIHTVSRILGHSSVWFTYDTYVHLLPETQKRAADNQIQIMQRKISR